MKNSHEFVHEYMKRPDYVELMRRLGALGDGNQDQSKISACVLFSIISLLHRVQNVRFVQQISVLVVKLIPSFLCL